MTVPDLGENKFVHIYIYTYEYLYAESEICGVHSVYIVYGV